jgi:hypothetical protein
MATRGDGAVRRDHTSDLQLLVDSAPSLIHTATPDGYLDFFNQTWLRYVGRALEDLQGWKWTAFIHPEDVEGIVEKWRAEFVAGLVLQAIEEGQAQYFANDRLRKMAGRFEGRGIRRTSALDADRRTEADLPVLIGSSMSALAIYHSSRLRAVWKPGWLGVNPWLRKVRKPLRNSLGATRMTRLKALLNVASES